MFREREAALKQLEVKRQEIDGLDVYDAVGLLALSIYVVEKNHVELDAFIRECEAYMPMVRTPAYRNQAFLIELNRYLHNYCAAAYSFQQHLDVFQKRVPDEHFRTDLKAQLAEAGSNNCGRFFQDLRRYLQHYAPPPILSELRYKEGPPGVPPLDPVQELLLEKEQLLKWDNWKSQARTFINETGDIPLRTAAREHLKLLLDLYSWTWRRIRELYTDPFNRLDAIGEEIARLYGWRKSQ